MSNSTITNLDPRPVMLGPCKGLDATVRFAGAGTFKRGTLLGRLTTVTASVVFVPFVPGGSDGAGKITGVIVDDLVATGAGDLPARPVVQGTVNRNLLLIDADGDDSNLTLAHEEQMRDSGLFPEKTTELGVYDNPQS